MTTLCGSELVHFYQNLILIIHGPGRHPVLNRPIRVEAISEFFQNYYGVRLSDGCRLYAAPCGTRAKWHLGRRNSDPVF